MLKWIQDLGLVHLGPSMIIWERGPWLLQYFFKKKVIKKHQPSEISSWKNKGEKASYIRCAIWMTRCFRKAHLQVHSRKRIARWPLGAWLPVRDHDDSGCRLLSQSYPQNISISTKPVHLPVHGSIPRLPKNSSLLCFHSNKHQEAIPTFHVTHR